MITVMDYNVSILIFSLDGNVPNNDNRIPLWGNPMARQAVISYGKALLRLPQETNAIQEMAFPIGRQKLC